MESVPRVLIGNNINNMMLTVACLHLAEEREVAPW